MYILQCCNRGGIEGPAGTATAVPVSIAVRRRRTRFAETRPFEIVAGNEAQHTRVVYRLYGYGDRLLVGSNRRRTFQTGKTGAAATG